MVVLQGNDGEDELQCKICNQFFISVHNKKEHMFGRQHIMAITSKYLKHYFSLFLNDTSSGYYHILCQGVYSFRLSIHMVVHSYFFPSREWNLLQSFTLKFLKWGISHQ